MVCAALGVFDIYCSTAVYAVSATSVGGEPVTVGSTAPPGLLMLTLMGGVLAVGGIAVALIHPRTTSARPLVSKIYRVSALICAALGLLVVVYSRGVDGVFAEQVAAPAVADGSADPLGLVALTIVGVVLTAGGIVVALIPVRSRQGSAHH